MSSSLGPLFESRPTIMAKKNSKYIMEMNISFTWNS